MNFFNCSFFAIKKFNQETLYAHFWLSFLKVKNELSKKIMLMRPIDTEAIYVIYQTERPVKTDKEKCRTDGILNSVGSRDESRA